MSLSHFSWMFRPFWNTPIDSVCVGQHLKLTWLQWQCDHNVNVWMFMCSLSRWLADIKCQNYDRHVYTSWEDAPACMLCEYAVYVKHCTNDIVWISCYSVLNICAVYLEPRESSVHLPAFSALSRTHEESRVM